MDTCATPLLFQLGQLRSFSLCRFEIQTPSRICAVGKIYACANSISISIWRISFFYSLHEEIKDFYDYMCPTAAERYMRQQVVQRIRDVIHDLWPQAKVGINYRAIQCSTLCLVACRAIVSQFTMAAS